MRRAIARGRIVPQSLSTDPRMGRVSLKAALLFPLMWINCDDQGRLAGDPDEIKYATCPNIDGITKADIPKLLTELEEQGFLKVYATSKTQAIQMLDWWEEQHLQWAYPSHYSPAPGWQDKLRYHPTPTEIITENWPKSLSPASKELPSKLPKELPNELPSKLDPDRESTKEINETEKERGKGRGRGKGKGTLPSTLGSVLGSKSPSPSPTVLPPEQKKLELDIYQKFIECMPFSFGKQPDSRDLSLIRDYSKEFAAARASPQMVFDAFKEAANHQKMYLSYVHAVVLDWLGVERNRSP